MTKKARDILHQVIALVIGIIIVLPIIYAVSISFMPKKELITQAGQILPSQITLDNYKQVLDQVPLGRYLLNSVIVALVSSLSRIVVALMSAYAFAFIDFKGKKYIFAIFILATLVPSDIMLMPNYSLIADLGWVNTYAGICSISMVSLSAILLVRQNFLSFPQQIKEASQMDGCNNCQFATKVLIPICKPIIITIFLTSFIAMWNDYMWPLIITTTEEMRTIQIGITMIKSRESINYGPVMAGAVLAMLPTIIVFLIFRKQIVEGMSDGGVKQ